MKKIFIILISLTFTFVALNSFAQEAGDDQIRPCDYAILNALVSTDSYWTTEETGVIIVNSMAENTIVENLPIGSTEFTWHYNYGASQDNVIITRVEADANAGTDETEIKTCGTETFLNAEHPAGVNGEWSIVNGSGQIIDNTYFHTQITNLDIGAVASFEWKIFDGTCEDADFVDVIATEDLYINPPINGPGDVCPFAPIEYTTLNTDDIYDDFQWNVQGGEIVYESQPLRDTIRIMWYNNASEYFVELNSIYGGCIAVNNYPINVGVGKKPEILKKGDNLLICLDSGMVNYRWFVNEQEIQGENRQFYYSENLNGNYFVETKAENNCIGKSDMLTISTKKTKLFPNPVSDIINIEIKDIVIGNVLFNIKDLTGKTVKTYSANKNSDILKTEIPINDLKSGVYTLNVVINNKKYSSGRLIIQ